MHKLVLVAYIAIALFALGDMSARAAEVDGVWATRAEACKNIYKKKGGQVSFAGTADLHGSGFIIDGSRIRGKVAKCNIKARKTNGDLVHLIAACSTDIAIEPVQFTLKVLGPDKVVRVFQDMPDLNIEYSRCRL